MRPFELLKLFKLFALRTKGYTLILLTFLTFFTFLPFLPISNAYAAPQMADYCYIPPFVTDPNTTPNIMFVYEKGSAITKRAYSTTYTYDSANPYYGFFDSKDSSNNPIYYNFSVNASKAFDYFEKSSTCSPATTDPGNKCISGDILNWALMTTLDLSRKVLVGFGWPKAVTSQGAGDVYTYSGCFMSGGTAATCSACANTSSPPANCQVPISYGQYEDGNADTTVTVSVDTDGNGAKDYTYRFCISKGNPESFVTVNGQAGTTAPSCPNPNNASKCNGSSTCLGSGKVAMKFTSEDRKGLIQEYADKDSNYEYDSDAPRFGLRRWKTSTAADERDKDILCDNATGGNCTSTSKTTLLKDYLNAFSKEPGIDPDTAALGTMMKDVINYFKGNSSTYEDKDSAYTQTPYKWLKDPAYKCRKTYAIFVTTGAVLSGGAELNLTEVSPACDSLTYTDEFVKATCYGFNKDLYDDPDDSEKKQNIRTYVVHTDFYGNACTTAAQCAAGQTCSGGYCRSDVARLTYAAKNVGGGEYISVNNPASLKSKIEEAFLNIISTSASASTVATLTTQTRESSTLTQAYFYPKREGTDLKWIGYLRLLWSDTGANLREDTENTGWLDLKKDKILSFYYDPGIDDPGIISYRARIYNPKISPADPANYLKIDSCSASTTKKNDDVFAIWNAQTKLLDRTPAESAADKRNIKVGIDSNNSGFIYYLEAYDFTTALNSTLYPYWNYTSYCSNYTSRWCAATSDCNYCTTLRGTYSVDRGCSDTVVGADPDCYYCDGRKTRKCSTNMTCINTATGVDTGDLTCATVGASCSAGVGICVGDCYEYNGTCDTGSLVCDVDGTTACGTINTACTVSGTTGTCKAKCTIDTSQLCTTDAECINDYHGSTGGSGCITTDTCTTAAAGTCVNDCDANCAKSVIKFLRGYDKPSYTGAGSTSPGSSFRVRTQCAGDSDCTGGTCGSKVCSSNTSLSCTSDTDCGTGKCYGTCSSASYDITKTLKLGDIVYSTPRISPNSAVNGYDVTYNDETYGNFVKSTTIKNATPIVIVGANDGMVHAFKVGKIKDLTGTCTTNDDCPSEETCESGVCSGGGYQTARFTDNPPTSDLVPPSDIGKELWAYIPWNAVPYLKWYCSESYCHIPMADARFTIVDASIDYDKNGNVGRGVTETRSATDTRTCNTDGTNCVWRRLLIGAMGVGGKKITVSRTFSSSIFVLDITDPTSPRVLWERRMPDDTLTTSTPAVVRLASAATDASKNENGKWYLVIGSGPESVTTNKLNYKTGNARIFVFDLITGDEAVSGGLDIGASGVAVGDMMAVDIDSDYQVDDIYFGTYGGTSASQTGKLYRLRIRDGSNYQTTPANWDIETVVNVGRPIYASAEIAQDALGNKWLYFGTGLYLTLEHAKATADNEYLYGVKETEGCWKGLSACPSVGSTTTPSYTTFLDTSGISFTGAKAVELGCFCAGSLMRTILCESPGSCSGTCSSGENTVLLKVQDATIYRTAGVGDPIPTSPTDCTSSPNNKDTSAIQCLTTDINASYNGWKRAITGQKSFSKPFVAGGLADFTTFQPKSTVCSLGGDTYLYSLHYTTGTAYVQPTILACDAESGCSSATTGIEIKASVNIGTGVPPLGESLVALPLSGDTYKVITQVSGGLPGTSMAPSLPARSGYVLWLVK